MHVTLNIREFEELFSQFNVLSSNNLYSFSSDFFHLLYSSSKSMRKYLMAKATSEKFDLWIMVYDFPNEFRNYRYEEICFIIYRSCTPWEN